MKTEIETNQWLAERKRQLNDLKQMEGELISYDNTLNSINERISRKQSIIEAINKPGRPDKFHLEYGDRVIEVEVEQPEKYDKLEDLAIALLKADVEDLKKAVVKEQAERAKTQAKFDDLQKAIEKAAPKK